jgi:hypothetical protein
VIGKGCTVDVDLWLRLKTNHTPPGEVVPYRVGFALP